MPFVTGLLIIDAPASALNNIGKLEDAREENAVGVKVIRTKEGQFPYVSAQAFRYWLRATLDTQVGGWKTAPIYREDKVAYTDSNPLKWWDDDLLGYMRAPKKAKREGDAAAVVETELTKDVTLTRAAPFRVSTLVSIAPMYPTLDFGTMSRHEGNPVPYEHQFYRTSLKGLFSLDLHAAGTFSYRNRTGYRNLDEIRVQQALATPGIEHIEAEKSYRLPQAERIRRIQALFEGMARLEGGAKQTLHYTDVAPSLVILAVTRGGNHIFNHVVGADGHGKPVIKHEALTEALRVFSGELLSDVYVGWTRGYLDEERKTFEDKFVTENASAGGRPIHIAHPREAFAAFITALGDPRNAAWLA